MSLRDDLNKYTPRKEQKNALEYIKRVKREKPDNKFFLLNMPVGTGKSHLAMMIANYYIKELVPGSTVDIITAGKILQDQYDDTYNSICNFKGKENYDCSGYGCSCSEGKEFNKLNGTKCEYCPYEDAKGRYMDGDISLTNFHLYLIYAIYSKQFNDMRHSGILIVDEAHEFDDVISDFISIKITESIIKRMKFAEEKEIIEQLKAIKTIDDYNKFLKYMLEVIAKTIDQIEGAMGAEKRDAVSDKRDIKIHRITGGQNKDIKLMKIITDLKQYFTKITVFLKEYQAKPDNWVLETSYNDKTKNNEMSLEPIWAGEYLEKYIWSRYDMVVLMSGTILNKQIFSEINGIDVSKSVYYSISSPFPLKNRPIYYKPLGKSTYTKKEETFKNYIVWIEKILKKFESNKGLIHTNSFELSSWIQNKVLNTRLLFHDSQNKNEILRQHFENNNPSVLVSPSMSTGVSFDDDRSRFQIIAKIPYPSLGSKKNKMRQKQNPQWYALRTVQELLQMSGRIVRSETDYGATIIIDGSFSDILMHSSHFIPQWWQNSVKTL